jgi:hypothetical protein
MCMCECLYVYVCMYMYVWMDGCLLHSVFKHKRGRVN